MFDLRKGKKNNSFLNLPPKGMNSRNITLFLSQKKKKRRFQEIGSQNVEFMKNFKKKSVAKM
jgi:hypothetical protein